MKIKMLKPSAMDGLKKGEIYDLPELKAEFFIKLGAAESLEVKQEELPIIEKKAVIEETPQAIEEKPKKKRRSSK